MACEQNFEFTSDMIKFKHYLLQSRNHCHQFILRSDNDPFCELKIGLNDNLAPFVNVEEAIKDLNPLRDLPIIRFLKWFNMIILILTLG